MCDDQSDGPSRAWICHDGKEIGSISNGIGYPGNRFKCGWSRSNLHADVPNWRDSMGNGILFSESTPWCGTLGFCLDLVTRQWTANASENSEILMSTGSPPLLQEFKAIQRRELRALLFLVLGMATVVSAHLWVSHGWAWFCGFQRWLGIPCPFCGGTRSLAALFVLDWQRALSLNPFCFSACVLLMGGGFAVLIDRWFRTSFMDRLAQWSWMKIFLIGLILNWGYLCWVR
jgi:hypothetical protein